jgi:hypothetical protein
MWYLIWHFGYFMALDIKNSMTDKENFRDEIEKAYNEAQNRVKLVKDEYWEGKVDAYRNVLCIFDSMQEEPSTSVWHDKSEKPLYNKTSDALNMIAVAGVNRYSNGQEAMSVGELLSDGKIYAPISGKEYKFEECPFTKWAYVKDLLKL